MELRAGAAGAARRGPLDRVKMIVKSAMIHHTCVVKFIIYVQYTQQPTGPRVHVPAPCSDAVQSRTSEPPCDHTEVHIHDHVAERSATKPL